MSAATRSALRAALDASHAQARRPRAPDFPTEELEALQSFQRQRLSSTYADLAGDPRYADAARFFLEELYGGKDASARDRQVDGALPIMERTLPGQLKAALADAFRLQGLSLELDIALALAMADSGWTSMNVDRYAELYPVVPRTQREEQIVLIGGLARALDRVVHVPFVLGLVVAMRGPARAMGFRELQAFLERGLRAFRTMGQAESFARTIVDRETLIMERLYGGEAPPLLPEDQTSQPK